MTQPAGAPGERTLANRYGRPATRGRRQGQLAVGVAVVLLAAWAVWAAFGASQSSVGALVQSFRVTSPHEMSVTVQITRGSADAVRCTVTAIASDHSEVGQTVVTLPTGRSGTQALTATVKTERAATSADVGRCH